MQLILHMCPSIWCGIARWLLRSSYPTLHGGFMPLARQNETLFWNFTIHFEAALNHLRPHVQTSNRMQGWLVHRSIQNAYRRCQPFLYPQRGSQGSGLSVVRAGWHSWLQSEFTNLQTRVSYSSYTKWLTITVCRYKRWLHARETSLLSYAVRGALSIFWLPIVTDRTLNEGVVIVVIVELLTWIPLKLTYEELNIREKRQRRDRSLDNMTTVG